MASVVMFWQYPEEEQKFLDYLLGAGEILAFPLHRVRRAELLTGQPIVPFIQQNNPNGLLFGLDHHAAQARIEAFESASGPMYAVSAGNSCLMDYRRPRLLPGGKLTQCSLCAFGAGHSEDGSTVVLKDPAFMKWARKVITWGRRHSCEWDSEKTRRATPRVAEALKKGEVELVV